MIPQNTFSRNEILNFISHYQTLRTDFSNKACKIQQNIFSNGIYIRGLLEISSFCRCNCLYCGIRKDNSSAERYRLSDSQIFERCEYGYSKGFRTFVLQGGEDLYYSANHVASIITKLKQKYPDCAVTLSLGERDYQTYKLWKNAGADRYLLRHEAASPTLFKKLHPLNQTLENRIECLFNLKELGYQVGSGFMVGSPFQTIENIADDIIFLQKLQPQMIGIGPFIPHNKTPFANYNIYNNDKESSLHPSSVDLTLFLISLLRIIFPFALIPATTALNTLNKNGRKEGILSGANVIMPNLSPLSTRKKYDLYEGKNRNGIETADELEKLKTEMNQIGYKILLNEKGDYKIKKLPEVKNELQCNVKQS